MVIVRFRSENGSSLAYGETRLVDLLDELDGAAPIPLGCRSARCGVCCVRVLRGAALCRPMSAGEQETLAWLGAAPGERLGCQLAVDGTQPGELVLERRPRSRAF